MTRLPILAGIMAMIVTGCGNPHPVGTPESGIDADTFVEVYIELRRAAIDADSTVDFESRKAEILERHGLTGQELLDFIELRGEDLDEMAAVWDSIHQRLRRGEAKPDDS